MNHGDPYSLFMKTLLSRPIESEEFFLGTTAHSGVHQAYKMLAW